MATGRRRAVHRARPARRSRLVVLGLSAGALVGLVLGMAATARTQPPAPSGPVVGSPSTVAPNEPEAAEPAGSPFAGQRSITQTGAS